MYPTKKELTVRFIIQYDADQFEPYEAQQQFLEAIPDRVGAVTVYHAEIVEGLVNPNSSPIGPHVQNPSLKKKRAIDEAIDIMRKWVK